LPGVAIAHQDVDQRQLLLLLECGLVSGSHPLATKSHVIPTCIWSIRHSGSVAPTRPEMRSNKLHDIPLGFEHRFLVGGQ